MNSELEADKASAQRIRSAPRQCFIFYSAFLCVLYIFVRVHTPMTILAGAPHDDTLFMQLAEYLVQGQWFGPYNEFTLVKGPGYPFFLAASYLAGTSVSLSTALFHCSAVTFFSFVSHRFLRSYLLSAILFTLLLWHPSTLSIHLLRVYREEIYYAQALIFLAALIAALFADNRKARLLYSILAGAVLGWLWLTREEGVWVLPGTAVLLAIVLLYKWRAGRAFELAFVLAITVGIFAIIQVGFRAANLRVYGSFVGVDFKERNYQRALAAIHSVRSGGFVKSISISRAARERVYAVSPAFATLKYYLDGPPGEGWAAISCQTLAFSCGEIGSGWFIFAVRHAASGIGHYRTPADASQFFGQVADEIEAACANKQLECVRQPIAEMNPVDWRDVLELLPKYSVVAFNTLLFMNPPLHINGSGSNEASLGPRLRFLNYPMHTRSTEAALTSYSLSGWYHRSGRDWVSVAVQDAQGATVASRLDRRASPDLPPGLKDPDAAFQRFVLTTTCRDECVIRFENPEGGKVQKSLGDFRNGAIGFPVGDGHVHVDVTTFQEDPAYTVYRSDRLAERIRLAVLRYYQYFFLPILALAAIAFVIATTLFWRTAIWNACYALALVSLGYTAARMGLLVIMGSTMSTSLHVNPYYGAPAFFHLVCAAIFSIAAALQLLRHGQRFNNVSSEVNLKHVDAIPDRKPS